MPKSMFAAPMESQYFEDYEPDSVHEFGPFMSCRKLPNPQPSK